MLANVTSAQILIAESIYEQMKSVPGFRFNSKAVREAGETFGPEAIYEMLWTDESTYGHLRQPGRAGDRGPLSHSGRTRARRHGSSSQGVRRIDRQDRRAEDNFD